MIRGAKKNMESSNQFYLFKSKNSPFYQIAYWKNGKQTSKSTKAKMKTDALKFLTEFKERINHKKIIPKTLYEFEKEFLLWCSNTYSQNYINRAVKLSFRKLKEFIGKDILLSEISVNLADKFFSSTFSRSEHSARLYLRTLKSAINTAIRWGIVENNVFSKIKAPKPFKTFPVYITEIDLDKICLATKDILLRNLFRVAFHSGMRLGEILSLQWKDVDMIGKTITLSNSDSFKTKNKRDRLIPINQSLIELFSSMKKNWNRNNDDFIFSRVKGVKLNGDYVSKKFKKAVRAAGLSDKIHFHTLRHSFASLIHQKGASLTVVKELLGHQDLKTTLIYSHLSNENLVNAVELIGATKKSDKNFTIQAGEIPINLNLN